MFNKLNNNKTINSSNSKVQPITNIKNNSKTPNTLPSNKIITPTLNTKTTKSTEIAINSTNTNPPKDFQTAKEEIGIYEVVSTNYLLLIGITSVIVIILIIYIFSSSFRVGRTVNNMVVYQGYQQIMSIDYASLGTKRLGDFHIASAYNAAHSGYQMYDYTSELIVLSLLQSGVRYLEFNIFNSEFGDNAFPVVSMGYKVGEWKMMVTDTPLETIFDIISKNAFKISEGTEGVNNPDDPLFIGLNLNTNSNLNCLNLIAYLIVKYFGTRLLDNRYSFQHNDHIADIQLNDLTLPNDKGGKVVIFASDGFQGSGLEEIVNYSWDHLDNSTTHTMQRLHYSDIIEVGFDEPALIAFNKTGLTIIVPHIEGDFFNSNYDPTKAFALGCQFIAMEYQYIDSNMDMYIPKFKMAALIMKQESLQKESTSITISRTTIASTVTTSDNIPRITLKIQ